MVRIHFQGTLPRYDKKIGSLNYKINKYILKIKSCTKCFRFAHIRKTCRGPARCHKCGNKSSNHICDPKLVKCLACFNVDHLFGSPTCPLLKYLKPYSEEIYKHNISIVKLINSFFGKQGSQYNNVNSHQPLSRHNSTRGPCVTNYANRRSGEINKRERPPTPRYVNLYFKEPKAVAKVVKDVTKFIRECQASSPIPTETSSGSEPASDEEGAAASLFTQHNRKVQKTWPKSHVDIDAIATIPEELSLYLKATPERIEENPIYWI